MPEKISESQINRLRESLPLYRKIIGYSAEKFGSFIGLNRQQISSLETGRTKLTQVHYRAICQIINETISERLVENEINIALFVIQILLRASEEDIDDNEYLIWIKIITRFSQIKELGSPENQMKLMYGFAIAEKNLKKGDIVPSLDIFEKVVDIFTSTMQSINKVISED